MTEPLEPLAVSVEEAKRHLGGISTATIYRMFAKEGGLEKKKVGGRTLITWASVKAQLHLEAA